MSRPADRVCAMLYCLQHGWTDEEVRRAFSVSQAFLDVAKSYGIGPELPLGLTDVRDHALKGLTPVEIAQALEVSQQTVYNRLNLLRTIKLLPAKPRTRSALAEQDAAAHCEATPPAPPPPPPAREPKAETSATPDRRPDHERLFEAAMGEARYQDDTRAAARSRLVQPRPVRSSGTGTRTLGGVVGAIW